MHHETSLAYRQLKAQIPVAAQWLTVFPLKAEQVFATELNRAQFYNHVVHALPAMSGLGALGCTNEIQAGGEPLLTSPVPVTDAGTNPMQST